MAKEKISAIAIIHQYGDGRISSRPEYYSGRGVNRGDLNGSHLKMIYTGIKEELGDDVAVAFVSMIEHLKDMSATAVLKSIYRLERAGWIFVAESFNQSTDGIAFNDEVTAFCTAASLLFDKSPSAMVDFASNDIKREFFGLIGHSWKQSNRHSSSAFDCGFEPSKHLR